MTLMRKGLAVLAGIVFAGLVIAAMEALGHAFLTSETLFAAVVVGYGLGALTGTGIATYFSDSKTAAIVPMILAGLVLVNVLNFPHPRWFVPAAVVALLSGWYLGSRITSRSRRERSGTMSR